MLYNSSHLTSRRNGANEIHLFCGALKDLTDLHLNTVKDPLSQLYSGPLKGYLIFLESLRRNILMTLLIMRQLIFQHDGNVALCLIPVAMDDELACVST